MKLVLYGISIFIAISSFSQKTNSSKKQIAVAVNTKNSNLKRVYINPEEDAILKINLSRLLAENLQYPDSANLYGEQGSVRFNFIVELNGTISDIKLNDDSPNKNKYLMEELIRVLKLTNGKWKPAKDNGKVVRSRVFQLFYICIMGDE